MGLCSGPSLRWSAVGVIRRLSFFLVGALVAALLAGCTNTSNGMMARGDREGTEPGLGAMMRAAPHGYHMSRLTCSAPSSLPGKRVYVMLGDMGMTRTMGGDAPLGGHMMLRALPARVPAGKISFVVANMGWRTHEMVVLPLAPGQQTGQQEPGANGRIDEAGSLGEASTSCAAGEGDGIRSGSAGWVTLDLPAGRYELMCNLRHHYANGMHQLLVVG